MMRDFDKRTLLLIVPLAHTFWPWLAYRLPSKIPFAFGLLWCILSFARSRRSLYDPAYARSFFWLVVWYIVAHFSGNLWAIFDAGDYVSYGEMATALMSLFYLFVVYILFRDFRFAEIKFLLGVILVFSFLAALSSLKGIGIEGFEGARATTGINMEGAYGAAYDLVMEAKTLGLGSYGHMYQYALLIVPLLIGAFYVKNIIVRVVFGLLIVFALMGLRSGGLGTPYFVLAFMLGIGVLAVCLRSRKVIGFGTALILIVMFMFARGTSMFSAASPALLALSDHLSEGSVKERVVSMSQALSGDRDTYAFHRYQLQMMSWETFCSHPIFGIGAYNIFTHVQQGTQNRKRIQIFGVVGGHSRLFDTLAFQGIVGFIPYVVLLICYYKFCRHLGRLFLGEKWLLLPSLFIAGLLVSWFANPMAALPGGAVLLLPVIAFYMPACQGRLTSQYYM